MPQNGVKSSISFIFQLNSRLILKCFTGISSFLFPSLCGIMPYFPIDFLIYFSVDLNREKLVAFAVLVGCDYFPQGVRGVGEEKAKKLISAVNHRNLLERLFLTSHALQNEVKLKEFKQRRCLPKPKLSMLFIKRGKKRASRTLLLLSVRHV